MNKNKILMIVLYVILAAAIIYAVIATKGFGLIKSGSTSGDYQAVFLTNGQVYFGKLANTNGQWATLTDIFYLQVQQQVQPTDGSSDKQSSVTLVKLGNELHGPADEMKINRDQILFWENLKNDGKVLEAITKYKQNGPSQSSTPSSTPTK